MLIYYLIAINYIATLKLILNVSNQIFNKINRIKKFILNRVSAADLRENLIGIAWKD